MVRIALDAMGGDNAPAETVAGAVDASNRGVDVVLVGAHDALADELAKHDTLLPIVDAPEIIGMADDPTRAIREKPSASVVVAARLVAEGNASGFVSAGSTGAAMASAAVVMGRIRGISRPPLATVFPTPGSPTMVLDMGANPEVKPDQLVQFAAMGCAAMEVLLDVEEPRVGLLSNGEERGKGRDLEKATFTLLEDSDMRFIGNFEGRDIAADKADVVVTDGFTGNVFLKTMEGTAAIVAGYTMEELVGLEEAVRLAVLPLLTRVRERLDYETYGGAQLLGVKGMVVISHGSSTRTSIANALAMAKDGAERDLPGRVASGLAAL